MTFPVDKGGKHYGQEITGAHASGDLRLLVTESGLIGISAQGWPCCSPLSLSEWSPKTSLLWRITQQPPGAINVVVVFFFFERQSHASSQQALGRVAGPAEGKSLAKSEPAVFLLRAPGCLCVRPKGMGGTSFAFPFLTLFSYFWMHVYLNTHTHVCVSFFFFFLQAGQSNQTTFFLLGLSVHVCDEARAEGWT